MKYPFFDGHVRDIQGDQEVFRKCYVESLMLKSVLTLGMDTKKVSSRIKPPKATLKGGEAPPQKIGKKGD